MTIETHAQFEGRKATIEQERDQLIEEAKIYEKVVSAAEHLDKFETDPAIQTCVNDEYDYVIRCKTSSFDDASEMFPLMYQYVRSSTEPFVHYKLERVTNDRHAVMLSLYVGEI
jgi:hypothetical protein